MTFSDTEHTDSFEEVKSLAAERESGWICISRCTFEHPIVGAHKGSPRAVPGKGQPYSYMLAWIWLLREASFKSRVRVVSGIRYELGRSEIIASDAFLARAWNWSPKAVECFLKKLRGDKMISRGPQKGRLMSKLTICNYDKYQMGLQWQGGAEGGAAFESTGTTRKKVTNTVKGKTPPTPSGDEPVLPIIAEADAVNAPRVASETLTKTGNDPALAASEVRVAFERYNAIAKECGLPVAKMLTEDRARKIRAKLKAGGMETWDRVLTEVTRSKFLQGRVQGKDGRKPFKADLEFVLQPKSFNRLNEGFYTRNAGDVIAPTAKLTSAADIEALAAQERREYQDHLQAQRAKRAIEASQDGLDF
jgi:hypothetical protein